MNDRPTAEELLEAVGRFLSDEAVPGLEGHLKYQARVAANVLRIVARELATGDRHVAGEWERLGALLEDDALLPDAREAQHAGLASRNAALVARIRAGDADAGPWRDALIAHLQQTTADKLEVAKGPVLRDVALEAGAPKS